MRAGLIASIACGVLALGVVGQAMYLRETRRELDEMQAKVDRLEMRNKEAAAISDRALEEMKEEIAKAEKKAETRPPPAAAGGKPDQLPTLLSEEDIQKIVDEKVEQKLQARGDPKKQGQQGGDRKMPLHDIAKELALDAKAQEKVADIANDAKREIFDILKTPRPDGTNVADELIDVMLKGDQAGAQQLFQRLFTERIPGTQTTYLAGVGAVQDRARQLLQVAMGPDAYGQFEHMNIKPENIETGYEPFGQYLQQRGGK